MSFTPVFSKNDVEITEEKTLFAGFFKIKQYILRHKLFAGGTSQPVTRELFMRGASVGVLLYDPDSDRVGLTQQFRIGCLENTSSPWVWEIIAGINDKPESPIQVAIREVEEESGICLSPDALIPICEYTASPGGSDERVQLFCGCCTLAEQEGIFGLAEEFEDILFKTFPYQSAINAMLKGEIDNAAAIIALQWLQLNRDNLKETK